MQLQLVLLFTSFLAIPLARQCFFHTALFARLQIKGVTLHFLNNVFLLDLALKPAQCIFKRFAFLNTNLCQKLHLQTVPARAYIVYREITPNALYNVTRKRLLQLTATAKS
jgi:hypothetical protein